MIFNEKDLSVYDKYMKFHQLMLEEHSANEIAGTIMVQALSFYRTILTEDGYEKMIKTVYNSRHDAPKFKEE